MYYIKLEDDKSLVTTVYEPIYRGDHLDQKITYLVPLTVNDVDMLTAVVYLNFVRSDGEPDVVLLTRGEDKYKEAYFQYTLPVTCKLSRYAGEVITWMTIFDNDAENPQIMKSGENIIRVLESKNMDTYLDDWRCDKQLTALYQIYKGMKDEVTRLDERVDESNDAIDAAKEQIDEANDQIERLWAEKADSIVYNPDDNSVQLTSQGEPVGSKAFLKTYDGVLIKKMTLTTDGELIAFYDDGTYENFGKIVGEDGKVYVPHIDDHRVLSWTIEDGAGELPDPPEPVDLNPDDEWAPIDEDVEGRSDYVWERI